MSALIPAAAFQQLAYEVTALVERPGQLARTLARLGIIVEIDPETSPALDWFGDLAEGARTLIDLLGELAAADNPAEAVVGVLDAIDVIVGLVDTLGDGVPPSNDILDPAAIGIVAAQLPNLLLTDLVASNLPQLAALLRLLRVIDVATSEWPDPDTEEPVWWDPADTERLDFERLGDIISDPPAALRAQWSWEDGSVDADGLVDDLVDAVAMLGLPVRRGVVPDGLAEFAEPNVADRFTRSAAILPVVSRVIDGGRTFVEVGLAVAPLAGTGPGDDGIAIGVLSEYLPDVPVPFLPGWTVTVDGSFGGAILLTPSGVSASLAGTSSLELGLASAAPRRIELPLTTISLGGLSAAVAVTSEDGGEFFVRLGTGDGAPIAISIDLAAGSSFLSELVGPPLEVDLEFELGWSTRTGFEFSGAIGLELLLVIERSIGPLTLHQIAIAAGASTDGTIGASLRADASALLGPVAFSVTGIGIGLDVAFTGGLRGADVSLSAIPPTGLGLGLDLGVAKGGGFLEIDGGTYRGALQLEVLSIGISAFVILETDNPDVDGWSLMMVLFIELPAIQLGFGFTLSGVGGLAGLNRGIDPDALGSAVRSGSLNTILFPDDPIADATLILDTLAAIFPAADGQYVFGPVVKIGWGTPTLVEVTAGVIIELPDPVRIAIIGSVSAILPRPELALVELNLDVAGIIDFQAGTIAIDASLHNSQIVGFNLAGDMALRASFKGSPDFLLSLGGFHPAFSPPAGFPPLARLSIGLDAGPAFQISFECYIAITSNTVQFGAALAISASIAGFGIDGGAEFDALIQFNPFALRTSVGFHIAVTALGVDLMGVWLEGNLEGPNPWHITGSATFRVLGISQSISVDEIIGGRENEIAPATPDLVELMRQALDEEGAWAATTSSSQGVTLAAATTPDDRDLVVAPDAALEVGQNVVPLNEPIAKFGNAEDLDHSEFRLVVVDDPERTTEPVTDWFSPGHYHELQGSDRLAAPSFERMDAGLRFASGADAGEGRAISLDHESIVIDDDLDAWLVENGRPTNSRSGVTLRAADSVAINARSFQQVGAVASNDVFAVAQPSFAVADPMTGAASEPMTFLAATAARTGDQVVSLGGEDGLL